MSLIELARPQLPELRKPEGINLSENREMCAECAGSGHLRVLDRTDEECPKCHGKGERTVDTGREHLSFSSLSEFLNCGQRYAFHREARLEPLARRAPLELGSAYQKALEFGDPSLAPVHLRANTQILNQQDEDRVQIEEAMLEAAATLYLETWGQPDKTEFEYRVQLRNPWTDGYSKTFDLLGYADGLTDKGGWWELTENKLVGQIQQANIKKLPLDRQLALARYGIWRATGKAVREVRYRWMRKPSIRQKKEESVREFCIRLAGDYTERPEFYAVEEHLLTGEDDLVRTEAELWTWAEQLRVARRQRVWPRNTSVCGDYGGCAFMDACLGREGFEAQYRERPVAA